MIDIRLMIAAISWTAVAGVLLSLFLVVRAMQLRSAAQRREGELQRLRAQWEPILRSPPQHHEGLPFLRDDDILAWLLMWNQAQEATYALTGDPRQMRGALNGIAVRERMPARVWAWLHERDVARQLQVIAMLGHLRDASAVRTLRTLCDSPNALSSVAAAHALLRIDKHFAAGFAALMARHPDWPAGKVVTVVHQERESLAEPLCDLCRTAPAPIGRELVKYLRYLDPAQALPAVHQLLDAAKDAELLAGALKVLAAIGTSADAAAAANLAGHDDWRVRVQAANALGAFAGKAHVPMLSAMLDDSHWWVRYRAAQALGAIADREDTELMPILSTRHDRFARDVLTQVIAERELAPTGAIAS